MIFSGEPRKHPVKENNPIQNMNRSSTPRLLAALATAALAASSQAATLITNGDFESPVTGGDAVDNFDFADWVETNNVRMDSDDAGRVPGTNPNQVARFFTGSSLAQDLGHNWSSSDQYDLSFNASETWWRTGASGDSITVSLRQVSDEAVLWTTGALNLDGLHTGAAMSSWDAGQTFNYSIDASSDFSGGTAGEEIQLFVEHSGGVSYFDNVSLSVIPEPSAALLSAAGVLMLLRRRRN